MRPRGGFGAPCPRSHPRAAARRPSSLSTPLSGKGGPGQRHPLPPQRRLFQTRAELLGRAGWQDGGAWRPARGQSLTVPAGRAVWGPEPGQEGRVGGQGPCGFLRGRPRAGAGGLGKTARGGGGEPAGQLLRSAWFTRPPLSVRPSVRSREPHRSLQGRRRPQAPRLRQPRAGHPAGDARQQPRPSGMMGRELRAAWPPPTSSVSPLPEPQRGRRTATHGAAARGEPAPGRRSAWGWLGAQEQGCPVSAPDRNFGSPGDGQATPVTALRALVQPPGSASVCTQSRVNIRPLDREIPGMGPRDTSAACTETSLTGQPSSQGWGETHQA